MGGDAGAETAEGESGGLRGMVESRLLKDSVMLNIVAVNCGRACSHHDGHERRNVYEVQDSEDEKDDHP